MWAVCGLSKKILLASLCRAQFWRIFPAPGVGRGRDVRISAGELVDHLPQRNLLKPSIPRAGLMLEALKGVATNLRHTAKLNLKAAELATRKKPRARATEAKSQVNRQQRRRCRRVKPELVSRVRSSFNKSGLCVRARPFCKLRAGSWSCR